MDRYKRAIFSIATIILVFLIFLGIQMPQWRTSFGTGIQTGQAQATSQQATIVAGLTQNASLSEPIKIIKTPTQNLFLPTQTNTPNPATKTIAAAFTQIDFATSVSVLATATAGASLTEIALTQTAVPSPTATLSKSNAALLLDKNYSCLKGPGKEYTTTTTLVEGLRFPIYGRNDESTWWLVQVQLSNFENGYCWINGGTIEGDATSVKIVVP